MPRIFVLKNHCFSKDNITAIMSHTDPYKPRVIHSRNSYTAPPSNQNHTENICTLARLSEAMKYRGIICLIVVILSSVNGFTQTYDPLQPPNSFRSPNNPDYWKNRKPYEGYWQQDVHYTIEAEIDERTNIISASEKLVYWNNSPDDLQHVFFHLYQNAFQPGSYYDILQHNNKRIQRYGKYESQKLGTQISKLTVDRKTVTTELDNTILKVDLPQLLKSGESITFEIEFKTYFDTGGNVRRRMKLFSAFGYKHYNGVHWYPRICVYDRKFGWTTDQHLGREFYGDFGTYDVELTFAEHFIVGATGFLVNRDEVLPTELRKKLDIVNFKDKEWNSPPSEIIPYDVNKRKTWKYHAENVHDFAFTADPTYRIGEAEWNGVKCYALAQEQHASKWQDAAAYTAKIVKIYSEDFGMLVYHKMISADARDGMEYPMLTLDGGYEPTHRGLLAHETAHNWFFAQVGNNETYRATLDEGFTTFLTSWCLTKLEGDTIAYLPPQSKYLQRYKKPVTEAKGRAYDIYLKEAMRYRDPQLNTHSDAFNGALRHGGGYRQVYFKTTVMLYNLQYVLGDELFQSAMQKYFDQWKICHPYFIDFRNSVIHFTKVDLNWFFDQWLEESKALDYSIKSLSKGKEKDEFQITFQRKGRMQMPIDFQVVAKDGKKYDFYIPNTWWEKETQASVLPRWIGWDRLKPTYTATVSIPSGISRVVIDPTNRLADINMLDNSSWKRIDYSFDHRIDNRSNRTSYEVFIRPDLWYNGYDGLKIGVHLNGDYMDYKSKFDLNIWFNSGLAQHNWGAAIPNINQFDQVSYRFNYTKPIDKCIKGSSIFLSAKSLDGMEGYSLGMNRESNTGHSTIYTYLKVLYRADSMDLHYLLYPDEWIPGYYNSSLNVGVNHDYDYRKGNGLINLNLRSSTLAGDYDYATASLKLTNNHRLGKFILKTRWFLQYGTGKIWPKESQLYLAGANPEELMDNAFTRSVGFVPSDWTGYGANANYFHAGGGLNLRGYSGYLTPFEDQNNVIRTVYKGQTGTAINAELEFNRLFRFNPLFLNNAWKVKTYLFADAGIINSSFADEPLAFADFRADAGVGTALTITKWGVLELVSPVTFRFDMPLFLNRIPATETQYVKYRWLVGVSRAF